MHGQTVPPQATPEQKASTEEEKKARAILSTVADSVAKGFKLCSFFKAVGDGATKF
jgi:hypothetical protein